MGFRILLSLKFCFPCRPLGYIFANLQIVGCEWQKVCCRSFLLVPSCDSQVLVTFTTGYPVVLGITTQGGSNFSYKMTFFFHYEEISNFSDYVISVFQLPYNNTSKTHNFFKFAKHVSIRRYSSHPQLKIIVLQFECSRIALYLYEFVNYVNKIHVNGITGRQQKDFEEKKKSVKDAKLCPTQGAKMFRVEYSMPQQGVRENLSSEMVSHVHKHWQSNSFL